MPKRILRPLLAVVLLMSAACSTLTPTGESVAQVTFNGAPQIDIISPQPNARYRQGADVYIVARVDNAGPDIGSMVVRIGDEIIAQQAKPDQNGSASFAINLKWPASRAGGQVISVSVNRADPSVSDMKTVDIEVVGAAVPSPTPTLDATPTTAEGIPTTDMSSPSVLAPEPTTDTSQPAAPVATTEPPTQAPPPTAAVPQVKVISGANVRKGPSTAFEPPLGSMSAGQTAEIVGRNPDSTWYKIKFYNGEGWIALVTVSVEGDVSNLPVDAGPPTPVPAVPTAIPATAGPTVPASGPDLVVSEIRVNPHPFTCGVSSSIVVVVKNIGTAASAGTEVVIQDLFNGSAGASTKTTVGAIQPGATGETAEAYLTVSTNYNQNHNTRAMVDTNANNTETNEGNNLMDSAAYVLAQGACP